MTDKKTTKSKDESSKIFCKECGAENSKRSKFCTNCGSLIAIDNKSGSNLGSDKETYKTKDRLSSVQRESDSLVVNNVNAVIPNFNFISTSTIVLLSIFTCGFYSYYLVYKWVEVINANEEGDNGLPSPIISLLLSFFTCGAGLIYFQYKIPERAAYLSRKKGGNTNPKRKYIKPPIGDLPVIALVANLGIWFLTIIGLFTGGILNILLFPFLMAFYSWLHLSIQRSIEYMLCIPSPNN